MKSSLIAILAALAIAPPAQSATLSVPASVQGNVLLDNNALRINTATRSLAVNTLSQRLRVNLASYGTGGRSATWNLKPGTYKLTWRIETLETTGNDALLWMNGSTIHRLSTSAIATSREGTQRVSIWRTNYLTLTANTLTLLAMNTNNCTTRSTFAVKYFAVAPEPDQTLGFLTVGVLFYDWRKSRTTDVLHQK